jgi:tetratricopeptide (TPR) repeat protein
LIESFYLAMPAVSWQTVVVGDVLCAPFEPKTLEASDLNPDVDPNTELPAFFQARRLKMLTGLGIKPEAAPWLARSEVEMAKKNLSAAREALEEATKIDAEYMPAQVALGLLYQEAEAWDQAIDRYQLVIAKNPTHAVALNNLASVMALHKGDLAGALPLARRAYLASVRSPATSDTLAWIYHLMADDSTADPIITIAAQRLPDSAEVRLHAAVILAGTGKTAAATQHLDAALRLDPTLDRRQEIQDLRKRLQPTK